MPIEDSARRIAQRLDRLRRALGAEIVRILSQLDGSDGRGLTSSADNLRNAVAVRAQILSALRDAGVEIVEEEIERAAAEVAADVLATVPGSQEFAPRAMAQVERVLRGQIDELARVWDGAADTLRLAIDRGVVTGLPLEGVIGRVEAALDLTFAQAETVVNSAIMGTHRATLLAVAEETGEELVYLYTGPDDGKTRPFCDQHEGKAFTKEALDSLDNGAGQPKPVSVFLGGYNCRHSLSPMTVEDALEEGVEIVT